MRNLTVLVTLVCLVALVPLSGCASPAPAARPGVSDREPEAAGVGRCASTDAFPVSEAETIWPTLLEIQPRQARAGDRLIATGMGGYLAWDNECGIFYDESARSFELTLDGIPAGFLVCYANSCRADLVLPPSSTPGTHTLSVEGGSSLTLEVRTPAAYPVGGEGLHLTGYLGTSRARAVTVLGGTAYLGLGPALTLLDVSSPDHIDRLGYTVLPGDVADVAVAGGYAYVVVDGDSGVHIVDVLDPRRPHLIGHHETGAIASGVIALSGHAYVTDGDLHVLDISEPASPVEVGTLRFPGGPLPASGRVATAADGYIYTLFQGASSQAGGLRIVYVSDPTKPTEVASLGLVGWPTGIAVAGAPGDTMLYLLAGYGNPHLAVVDASDPRQPFELELAPGEPWLAWTVAVARGMLVLGAPDLPDGPDVLQVVDVGEPSSPKEIGRYSGIARSPAEIAIDGDLAYVAAGDGMIIVDLADPRAPSLAGIYQPGALPLPGEHVVVGSDGYAFVAAGADGLQIVDVSDPANPRLAASLRTGGHAWATALPATGGPQTVGRYAYVADEFNGLRVIDVSNPREPVEIGAYDPPGLEEFFHGVAVDANGQYAYVADGGVLGTGFRILDVSDPAHPREVAFLPVARTPGDPASARFEDVALAEDHGRSRIVYAAVGTAGLWAVDVSDPATPVVAGVFDTPGRADNLAVSGHLVYLIDGDVRILDVSDPTAPVEVGFMDLPQGGWPSHVALGGDPGSPILYLTGAGVRVLDARDPGALVQMAVHPVPRGGAVAVQRSPDGEWIYVAGHGLFILHGPR